MNNQKLYVAHPDEIFDEKEIRAYWAESKDHAKMQYLEDEAKTDFFREHILDRGDWSSDYWTDSVGYLFKPELGENDEMIPRDDIVIRFEADMKKVNKYLNDKFENNIRQFFQKGREWELGEIYLDYLRGVRDTLPDDIYDYIIKNDENWINVIIHEIQIPTL